MTGAEIVGCHRPVRVLAGTTLRNGMRSIHPGEILREEFLVPLGLSARQLATRLRVPTNRITGVLNGTRSVTADTALRTTPEFWMNLQKTYELRRAEIDVGRTVVREILPST